MSTPPAPVTPRRVAVTGISVARMLADIFIRNAFQGGRSAPKVAKLQALDEVR